MIWGSADLGAWGLSWIEEGEHPRPGLAVRSGMIIGLPNAEGALSDRMRRATIRYYGPEPCGMEACIVVSDPEPVPTTLEYDMVVISVRSGPALNSLWRGRPERLDLHAPGAPAPDRAIGWIRVHYAAER